MSERLDLEAVLPGPPELWCEAWVQADQHAEMTGGEATGEPVEGAAFTAWDGYIEGRHLVVERPHRVVQAWRTSEFPPDAPDSSLTVHFEPLAEGTRLRLVHEGLPEGQADRYRQGWEEHYFVPMLAWFEARHG